MHDTSRRNLFERNVCSKGVTNTGIATAQQDSRFRQGSGEEHFRGSAAGPRCNARKAEAFKLMGHQSINELALMNHGCVHDKVDQLRTLQIFSHQGT